MRFDARVIRSIATAAVVVPLTFGALTAAGHAQSPNLLQQLPSVSNLVEKLSPAVVDISTTQKSENTGADLKLPELSPDVPFRDLFEDWLKRQRPGRGGGAPEPRTVASLGSGFVIDSSGIIVTNNHVVEDAASIQVNFSDGTKLSAELVGRDTKTDLAVLRVKPPKPLAFVVFGDSDKVRVGDWVLAIGNPFGLGGSVSLGIISARNRDINAGPYDDFIQTDAAINKGNSGGPLFNLAGEVMGINTAIYSPSGGSVGIGFAVPSDTAKNVVDQLLQFGETRRGWLGVRIQSVTDELAEGLDLGNMHGALVAEVTPSGPAEKAGIHARDVIVEFDGRPVKDMKDLPRIVADTAVGKKVAVKVMRDGKPVEVTAEVGRLEDGEKLASAQVPTGVDSSEAKALGMTLSILSDEQRQKFNIDADVKGVVVTEVDPGGPAAEKRIEPGDVITEAGRKPVTNPGDLPAQVKDAENSKKSSVLLYIAKAGKQSDMRFIAVKIK